MEPVNSYERQLKQYAETQELVIVWHFGKHCNIRYSKGFVTDVEVVRFKLPWHKSDPWKLGNQGDINFGLRRRIGEPGGGYFYHGGPHDHNFAALAAVNDYMPLISKVIIESTGLPSDLHPLIEGYLGKNLPYPPPAKTTLEPFVNSKCWKYLAGSVAVVGCSVLAVVGAAALN